MYYIDSIYIRFLMMLFRVAINNKRGDQIIVFIHCHIAISTSMHLFSVKRTAKKVKRAR